MKKVNGLLLGWTMALSFAGVIGATSVTKDIQKVKADDVALMIGKHDMIASPSFSSGGGTATNESTAFTIQKKFTRSKISTSWTTLPVGATNLKYNQTEQNLLVTEAVPSNGTVSYTLNGVQTAASDLKATNAGTYTIVAHANVDDDHEPLNDIELQVEIEAADFISVTHKISGTQEYNGEELIPWFSRVAQTYYDDPISWLYSLTEDGEYTNVIPTFTDAGDHIVYWKVVAPNHKSQGGSVVFTITPANLSNVSVTAQTSEFVYDGQAKELSVQTAGTTVDQTAVTFKYSLNEESGYETTLPTLTNAGEYTVYWKAEAANHNTVTGSFEATINKAASSFKEEPSAIEDLVYTGEPLELVEAGETDDGVIKYCVGDKEGVYSDVLPSGTELGTYVIWYMIEGDSNHNNSEPKSITVTINKASSGLASWTIALIIVGSILLLCLLSFFLLFFVFNKWIKKDDKAIRAVKFGKKDNKVRLLVMPFRFEYREETEVFKTKDEALK